MGVLAFHSMINVAFFGSVTGREPEVRGNVLGDTQDSFLGLSS